MTHAEDYAQYVRSSLVIKLTCSTRSSLPLGHGCPGSPRDSCVLTTLYVGQQSLAHRPDLLNTGCDRVSWQAITLHAKSVCAYCMETCCGKLRSAQKPQCISRLDPPSRHPCLQPPHPPCVAVLRITCKICLLLQDMCKKGVVKLTSRSRSTAKQRTSLKCQYPGCTCAPVRS